MDYVLWILNFPSVTPPALTPSPRLRYPKKAAEDRAGVHHYKESTDYYLHPHHSESVNRFILFWIIVHQLVDLHAVRNIVAYVHHFFDIKFSFRELIVYI
ncbi:MAG: hypothetical protein GY751_06030 [Bacteroidetes bacterium]|nr:hypothetical protein [Bacteroidota bacterium]